jgi:rhodanese-related sulfurtransferase
LPASAYTADITAVQKLLPDRKRRLVLYCNGLHCGRSKRLAAELRGSGYADVRRYQLGIPAWRALGGVTQVERDALLSLLARDGTAVLVDAREPGARPRIAKAAAIPLQDAAKAKDDGRLPMTDHNTRIFVVGDNGSQARAVAEAIVHDAFHNVSFFGGGIADLPELATHERP